MPVRLGLEKKSSAAKQLPMVAMSVIDHRLDVAETFALQEKDEEHVEPQ